ncbi:unnamed protein product [Rotaria socialis]|uniref:Uncharacterized protein n=1 Tax=Rotaria socialis TaxID=392032 RepID=A0A817NPS4_9BILA|nr:unnamed protein product [Rotaria socialis]CAF4238344.1 unnamed protein product [Rotaria socialis]
MCDDNVVAGESGSQQPNMTSPSPKDKPAEIAAKKRGKKSKAKTSAGLTSAADKDVSELLTEDEDETHTDCTTGQVGTSTEPGINSPSALDNSSSLSPISPKTNSLCWNLFVIVGVFVLIIGILAGFCCVTNKDSDTYHNDDDWREKVDPENVLSSGQRSTICASLRPILDKSFKTEEDSVSTLLILSSNEKYAADLARCILALVNTDKHKDKVSTEINLPSYLGDKIRLDTNMKSLLQTGDTIRALLLRHIDNTLSNDGFEQLRLLFAYCDGENPVISNRLIIMTATSLDESELREKFKIHWPQEHDFVDALMARISGHTLFVENDQKSIC